MQKRLRRQNLLLVVVVVVLSFVHYNYTYSTVQYSTRTLYVTYLESKRQQVEVLPVDHH